MSRVGGNRWFFLPSKDLSDFKRFLVSLQSESPHMEVVSALGLGKTVELSIPLNREPFLRDIFLNGQMENPFYRESFQILEYSLGDFAGMPSMRFPRRDDSLDKMSREDNSPIYRNDERRAPDWDMDTSDFSFDPKKGDLTLLTKTSKDAPAYKTAKFAKTPYKPMKADPKTGRLSPYGSPYVQTVKFAEWPEFLEEASQSLADGADEEKLFEYVGKFVHDSQIGVHCDCPAFHWTSPKYRLSLQGKAIHPTGIDDPVWSERHSDAGYDRQEMVCKHLDNLLEKYAQNPDMHEMIKHWMWEAIQAEADRG